ncbi:hypothetical protein [Vannielia sp.]|uniref:hypothetical protein n=1 Tax=Vannielia sp. TaxID=2813045 RepID=UPI0026023D93|nr:hypothetical protein [Vannielia sp.]MDF1873673.1 hypothetical protein [Vannielia sp.]
MNKSVFTGGHANSDRWAVCYATETADEETGKSQIFFVDFEAPDTWGHTEWNNAVAS